MGAAESITLRRGTLEDGFATYRVLREAVKLLEVAGIHEDALAAVLGLGARHLGVR